MGEMSSKAFSDETIVDFLLLSLLISNGLNFLFIFSLPPFLNLIFFLPIISPSKGLLVYMGSLAKLEGFIICYVFIDILYFELVNF